MFLRRAIGFIIYFIVISVFRIGSEIINDSLGLDDFLVIVSYSAVSVFVITILVSIIEFLISLFEIRSSCDFANHILLRLFN